MLVRHNGYGALFSMIFSLVQADYALPLNFAAIQKRLDCPANYFSCEDQGAVFAGTCCATGQLCALDQNNNAACCPSSAVCTGAAPSTTGGTATVSYVTNSLFNFPAIATSFSNSAACASVASACSSNYDICTSALARGTGGYAVTVVVPGGGTTVAPTHTTIPVTSATSICSSLSSRACYDLQSSRCATTGSGGGFYVGTAEVTGNGQPRQTAACMAGIFAVVGVGILGAQM